MSLKPFQTSCPSALGRAELVRAKGLEPPHLAMAGPKPAASTNSATPAIRRSPEIEALALIGTAAKGQAWRQGTAGAVRSLVAGQRKDLPMATQPDFQPDRIEPQSPPESPPDSPPPEQPLQQPDE